MFNSIRKYQKFISFVNLTPVCFWWRLFLMTSTSTYLLNTSSIPRPRTRQRHVRGHSTGIPWSLGCDWTSWNGQTSQCTAKNTETMYCSIRKPSDRNWRTRSSVSLTVWGSSSSELFCVHPYQRQWLSRIQIIKVKRILKIALTTWFKLCYKCTYAVLTLSEQYEKPC